MPIVTVQITKEGATPEQKAAVIRGVTRVLEEVLQKPPAHTYVIIQEIDLIDWGVAGMQVPEFRAQFAAQKHE